MPFIYSGSVILRITLNSKIAVFWIFVFCNQNAKVAKNILKTDIRTSYNIIVEWQQEYYFVVTSVSSMMVY